MGRSPGESGLSIVTENERSRKFTTSRRVEKLDRIVVGNALCRCYCCRIGDSMVPYASASVLS